MTLTTHALASLLAAAIVLIAMPLVLAQDHAASSLATAPTTRPTDGAEEWSKPVKGLRARLEVVPGSVSNGTRIMKVYLYLQNVSDIGNPMKLDWKHAKMTFVLRDEKGQKVPVANVPYDGLEATVDELVVPWDGTLKFNITKSGQGIAPNHDLHIDLGFSSGWSIKSTTGKSYTLSGTLQVPLEKGKADLDLPPASVPADLAAQKAKT